MTRPSRSFFWASSRLAMLASIVTLLVASVPARAETGDDAKRHFTNGVHLFEDRNFAGALVEFEASYRAHPTAVALQNIAVCQKGLFRYADAIATLERMLRDFGPQLSADDKKAAQDAIREMNALLGTIVVRVTPDNARITINDTPLGEGARQKAIPLAAGEYRVAADAPGFTRQEKSVTVVSGQKEVVVAFDLAPSAGSSAVSGGEPPSRNGTSPPAGPIDAKPALGDAKTTGDTTSPNDGALGSPPPSTPSQRGVFGFLTFGIDSMNTAPPEGLTNSQDRTGGGFIGLRGGYRFTTAFAAELLVESTSRDFEAFLVNAPDTKGQYKFTSIHVGPGVRLMTAGLKSRFVGTLAFGTALQAIAYGKALSTGRSDGASVAGFVQLSGGYELNLGHFLADAGLVLTAESADQQKVGIKNASSLGIELRVGYGRW